MKSKALAEMRISYDLATLADREANPNPFDQFRDWWDEVANTNIMEANAMAITTVGTDMVPQTRMVLMKDFGESGLVFYTNYGSAKARAIAENPNVCSLFYWPTVQRQVRFTGVATRVSAEESDAYFRVRPRGSQLGAWSSDQSQPITSADELRQAYAEFEAKFADVDEIPRPEDWGGFRIAPTRIEFWQGRENRLHDRIVYTFDDAGNWQHSRLAP